jgi:acetyl esterase/lipase
MNFTVFSLSITLFFSATIIGCQKGSENEKLAQMDMMNVAYGSDTLNRMDIYLPRGRDSVNTKAVLFIHGGSWSNGDKSDFNSTIAAIRPKLPDYAIFNINYRLARSDKSRFPTQLTDIDSALQFLHSKASQYQFNATKICLVGASAGGHLALLQAYKNNQDERIKAVVDLFGPTNMTTLYQDHPVPDQARPVIVNFLGATPSTNPNIYTQASPINFVNAQSVPTKIFHGSDDMVVPITQSLDLKAKLEQNNVKVDMTVYQNEGHGWYGDNLTDSYQKTVDFIKENVR